MYPFSITGSVRLDGVAPSDADGVAVRIERAFSSRQWRTKRDGNCVMFFGRVYRGYGGRHPRTFDSVGRCRLEVLPGEQIAVTYAASTMEMLALISAFALLLAVLFANLGLNRAAMLFPLGVWLIVFNFDYLFEAWALPREMRHVCSRIAVELRPAA